MVSLEYLFVYTHPSMCLDWTEVYFSLYEVKLVIYRYYLYRLCIFGTGIHSNSDSFFNVKNTIQPNHSVLSSCCTWVRNGIFCMKVIRIIRHCYFVIRVSALVWSLRAFPYYRENSNYRIDRQACIVIEWTHPKTHHSVYFIRQI